MSPLPQKWATAAADTGREFPGSHCDISVCALEVFWNLPDNEEQPQGHNDSTVAGEALILSCVCGECCFACLLIKIKSFLVLKAVESSAEFLEKPLWS